eukprot:g42699.t1
MMPALTAPDTPVPSVTAADIRLVFLGLNPRKVVGLDGVPGRALGSCSDQLAEVFTDIFSLSLLQAEVPTCFKISIFPVPKNTHAMCLNDFCPVALTSIIMKCFERLVMAHNNSSLPACLDPLQFSYYHNITLHSSLKHMDNKDTYVRFLLINYSSSFNTIIPSRLISKLQDLGLDSALYNWLLSFLSHGPQSVKI